MIVQSVCRGAFGLSTATQNQAVACFGDLTAYIAGRYVVAYARDAERQPRMLLSRPDEAVQHVVSLAASADHKELAAVEQLWDGTHRVAFWGPDMAPCAPFITQPDAKV